MKVFGFFRSAEIIVDIDIIPDLSIPVSYGIVMVVWYIHHAKMPQVFFLSRLQSYALHRTAAASLTETESTCDKRKSTQTKDYQVIDHE